MAVQIIPSVLREQVQEGLKLKELAEHYGLPVAQMKAALKQQGLTIRKFHLPKFVFVEESVDTEIEHTVTSEDIQLNPELEEQGVVVGDIVTIEEDSLENEVENVPQGATHTSVNEW